MNCSEFERVLEQLIETRSDSLPESAIAHAGQCDSCVALYRDHQLLNAAIVRWRPVETPATLAASVLNQLLDDQRTRPSHQPTGGLGRGWASVVAAAGVIAALGIGIVARSGSIEQSLAQRGQKLSDPSIGVATNAPVEVASSVAAVFDDLRSGYQELAADSSATARDLAVVIPTPTAMPWGELGMSNVAVRSVVPDEGLGPGGVTAVGRSIGTQITQAMDFLWTTLPAEVPRG